MDRILLIDGANFIWRACVKFGASSDQYDSVIFTFNFFRNLRPLIEQFSPDKCFFVLEGHPKFRYDLFPNYKSDRIIKRAAKQESTDNFNKTSNLILPLMQHLPITIARAANFEADDTIATLCENMKEEDITVVSGDSDFIQLLQRGYANITVYNPIKKLNMEAPDYLYTLWKSLNGDKSDSIPSLLKPKKALETTKNPELLKKWVEIEENRANLAINRSLIEFRYVPEEEINLIEGKSNFQVLKEEFSKLKFESIVNDNSWDRFVKTFNCIKY